MKIDLPEDLERALVSAALAFRAAAPWRELANTDYLLVDEPLRGLRALTILGNGREQYGLQSYAASCAPEWLFLLDAMNGMPPPGPAIVLELLEGETLELEAKAATDARDRARLLRAGYKPVPRARQAWPVFRQFRPGHFPWHIDEAAARRLLIDLRRALRWAELAPALTGRGRDPDAPVALRRLPAVSHELTTERSWTAEDIHWVQLQLPPARRPEPLALNPAGLATWPVLPRRAAEWWWVDERPQMVRIGEQDDEPPYFPRLGVCLDGRTGLAHPPGMRPAAQPCGTATLEALRAAAQATGFLPGEVRTPNEFLAIALGPWAEATGVALKVQAGSPALDEFWRMMEGFGHH